MENNTKLMDKSVNDLTVGDAIKYIDDNKG